MPYTILPNPDDDPAVCSCCAGAPGVRGAVYEDAAPVAYYLAEPAGMPKYPMLRLGLIVGKWTDDALPSDRLALAFAVRPGPEGLVIEAIEPYLATFPELTQLGVRAGAAQAKTHPELARFHALVEAVVAGDDRLVEMRPGARPRHRGFVAD